MKRYLLFFVGLIAFHTGFAQEQELQELALDIEKLAQFKQILSDLEKGYAILEGGYTTIKNISEGNFNLHQAFLDGLLAVSPQVAKYKKILHITDNQLKLVKEYKLAWGRFRDGGNFSPDELVYIGKVYAKLVDESAGNLESLLNIITANRLRMSDDERIRAIDRLDREMDDKIGFLRWFNNSAGLLAAQRKRSRDDVIKSKVLAGVER